MRNWLRHCNVCIGETMIRRLLALLLLTSLLSLSAVGTATAATPEIEALCRRDPSAEECKSLSIDERCRIDPNRAECKGSSELFTEACKGANAASVACQEAGKTQSITGNSLYGPNGILNKAANILLVAVGVAAVIMIMVGGISYALSNGDSARLNKSKDIIIYAIVGSSCCFSCKGYNYIRIK